MKDKKVYKLLEKPDDREFLKSLLKYALPKIVRHDIEYYLKYGLPLPPVPENGDYTVNQNKGK